MLTRLPVLASHVGTTRLGVEDWHFLRLVDLEAQRTLVCDGCGHGQCVAVEGPDLTPICEHCIRHDENLPIVLVERASVRPCLHCGVHLRPNRAVVGAWEAQQVAEALCGVARDSVHVVQQ